MSLHCYSVGDLYSPSRTCWPEDADYNHRSGQHELRLFLRNLTDREIEAIGRGPCDFALLIRDDVIVFLYRFGEAVPWSDKPFSIHLVPEAERWLPPPAECAEPHDLLHVILVEATTGIIKVLRGVTFSPAFSARLRLAIREQAARPWPGDVEYERQVQLLYRRYLSSAAMARDATARTRGGD